MKATHNVFIFLLSIVLFGNFSVENLYAKNPSNSYVLSLEDVSRLALENNFAIQLLKYDIQMERTGEERAKSIFDTMFEAEVNYRDNKEATTSTFFGSESQDNNYNISLSRQLSTGTEVSLGMTNARTATNSNFTTSPVTHESTAMVGISQDLGKNFFGSYDRNSIRLTQSQIQQSEFFVTHQIEDQLSQVQKAYWKLVQSKEFVTIAEAMVDQAKRLYDLQQEQLKDGLVEAPEAIASEANYQERMNELILARNQYASDMDRLKLLLNIEDFKVEIHPKDSLYLSYENEDSEESLQRAFSNRQDYKQKEETIRSKDIQLEMTANQRWPEINLTASFARNGLGGQFEDSGRNITGDDNPNFFTGLIFKMPLENRAADSQFKRSEIDKARAMLDFKSLERTIAIEVMNRVRTCNVLKQVANNSKTISDLKEKKLDEEEKRYNRGRSNTDTVIRFQEEFQRARQSSVRAMLDYRNAFVDLRNTEGILLSQYWNNSL